MSALRDEVVTALQAAGLAANRRLGQHFMVDAGALDDLLTALAAGPGDRVVEIGPGTGVLTRRLLAAGCTVLAVELDQGLAALLARELASQEFELVHGDCLVTKTRLHPAITAFAAASDWVLGANLPYDVAIPVLLNTLCLPRPPTRIAVTVQLEAAQRLCARPGSKAWGASAAVAGVAGTGRIVRRLPPSCFHPRPRVDSAILAWTPQRPVPAGFGVWCRQLFAYRRKLLPRALRHCKVARERAYAQCAAAGLDPERRVESLDVDELLALHAAGTGGDV